MKTLFFILWQLPQNVLALFVLLFTCVRIDSYNGEVIYVQWDVEGGISLGNFVFLSVLEMGYEQSVRHELGHVKQSRLLGWFYLPVIGIPSFIWAWYHSHHLHLDYYSFWTERWLMD